MAEGLSGSAARLTRLLTLVSTLTETARPLTARELRDRIEAYGGDETTDVAFRAMFERDKRELRSLGIELEVVELDHVHPPETGYRIARSNYALRDPGLTPEEAAAVQLALSLVRLEGLDDADGGGPDLWKLGAPAPAEVDAGPLTAIPGDPTLTVLFEALRERRVVTFGYRGEVRTVEPHRLQFARGRWYLTARDVDRGEGRLFRLDRFDGPPTAVGPPDRFGPPAEGELAGVPEPWQLTDGESVRVRVAVDGPQAGLARRILGEESVVAAEVAPDGTERVELAFDVTHRDGFRSFLLGFLEHAEVLEPDELRRDVVAWLESVP